MIGNRTTQVPSLEALSTKNIVQKLVMERKKLYTSVYAIMIISIFLISTLSTVSLLTGNTFIQPAQKQKDQETKQITSRNSG